LAVAPAVTLVTAAAPEHVNDDRGNDTAAVSEGRVTTPSTRRKIPRYANAGSGIVDDNEGRVIACRIVAETAIDTPTRNDRRIPCSTIDRLPRKCASNSSIGVRDNNRRREATHSDAGGGTNIPRA
jgi:hypothetical protein